MNYNFMYRIFLHFFFYIFESTIIYKLFNIQNIYIVCVCIYSNVYFIIL